APVLPEAALERLQVSNRSAEMRQAKQTKRDDDDRRRHRDEKRETAGVLRPEQIQQADNKNRSGRKFLRMRDAEILKRGERADRRRNEVIGDEQKRADDRNDFRAMAHARINAAA